MVVLAELETLRNVKSGSYGKESALFPADRLKEYFRRQVSADVVFSSLPNAENTADESGIIPPLLFPAQLSVYVPPCSGRHPAPLPSRRHRRRRREKGQEVH